MCFFRTITERDVRHLDRHLSMKKTIRKKIMRDLQQAFVQDNESPDNLDLNRLNFDPNKKAVNDANLLDLLKVHNQLMSFLKSELVRLPVMNHLQNSILISKQD